MESGTTVVVGAAHGIGAAIAHRVARELWTTRLVLAGISNAQMDLLQAHFDQTVYRLMCYMLILQMNAQ